MESVLQNLGLSRLFGVLLLLMFLCPSVGLTQERHWDRSGDGEWRGRQGNGWRGDGGWHGGGNDFTGSLYRGLGFGLGRSFGNWVFGSPPVVVQAPPPPVVVQSPPVVVAPAIIPGTPQWYAYCAQRYRSFDARSGTYLGYDGYRHQCL